MRISDWSSDVCSSDLQAVERGDQRQVRPRFAQHPREFIAREHDVGDAGHHAVEQRQRHADRTPALQRSEEHTSELQSLMRISYAVFCLKKKNKKPINNTHLIFSQLITQANTTSKEHKKKVSN